MFWKIALVVMAWILIAIPIGMLLGKRLKHIAKDYPLVDRKEGNHPPPDDSDEQSLE
jgi:hypothetical protein